MKISGWIGSIGWLAIASCGQQAANQPASTTAVVISPVAVSPAASPAQSPVGSIASPPAVPPAPSVLPVPDLIPPTSATARVPQIDAGRSNPYANVTTTPRVTVSPAASPRASVPTVAVQPAASARSTPTSASAPTATRPAPQSNSSPVAVRPAVNPSQPQAVPPRPTAELARSIAVSGVVRTSGQTSAIVQIPQEGSRYVRVGDRLAGGRVLVKRIEAGADEAIVVFEQDGVEVSRSVGSSGVL